MLCRKSDLALADYNALLCIIAKLRCADENNVLSAKAVITPEKHFSMAPQSRNNKTHLITQTLTEQTQILFMSFYVISSSWTEEDLQAYSTVKP